MKKNSVRHTPKKKKVFASQTRALPLTAIYTTFNDELESTVQRWIDRCSSNLTKITYSRSVKLWRHFLGYQDQERTMKEVHESDVTEFRDWLLRKGMKPNVVGQHMSVLARCYGYAIQNGEFGERNPFLDAVKPKTKPLPLPLIEPGEMRRILAAPTAPAETSLRGLRDRAILLVLAKLGLRVSEVVNLRNRDFVKEQVKGKLGSARWVLRIEDAKHGSSSEKPVVQDVEEAILEYVKADSDLRRGFGDKPDDPLFQPVRPSARQSQGRQVRPLSTRWVLDLTKHYAEYCGIEKTVSPHAFRRAAITRALDLGATYRQVMLLSGHKSIQTVQAYDLRRTSKSENAALMLTYEQEDD